MTAVNTGTTMAGLPPGGFVAFAAPAELAAAIQPCLPDEPASSN